MIFAREYQNNADLTRAEFTAAESRPILGFRDLPKSLNEYPRDSPTRKGDHRDGMDRTETRC